MAQIRNGQHSRNEKMRLTFEQQTGRDFRENGMRGKENFDVEIPGHKHLL